MVNEKYPEKMVEVIDSMTAGFGEGLQAIHAYELVKEGKSFDDIIKECEEFKHFVRSDFVVDDVRYLIKTGRVSKTVARFVRFLNIKAILKRNEASKIALGGTALGKVKAIKTLSKIVIENINSDIDQNVYITHCDCLSDAEELKNKLLEANIKDIEIYDYDVISAAHIGPNSLAVFYVAKEAY
jgi:DegV family protein with EDD domain